MKKIIDKIVNHKIWGEPVQMVTTLVDGKEIYWQKSAMRWYFEKFAMNFRLSNLYPKKVIVRVCYHDKKEFDYFKVLIFKDGNAVHKVLKKLWLKAKWKEIKPIYPMGLNDAKL